MTCRKNTGKVKELKTRAPAKHLFSSIRQAEERVKNGNIIAFAFCGVTRDGNVVTFYSHDDSPSLIGAAGVLHERMIREY